VKLQGTADKCQSAAQRSGSTTGRWFGLRNQLRVAVSTSRIVDPPNGRIPPLTAKAQQAAGGDREFYLALLQATETCKNNFVQCRGAKYDPTPSPRRAEAFNAGSCAHVGKITASIFPASIAAVQKL
jgi:hypothetical protein